MKKELFLICAFFFLLSIQVIAQQSNGGNIRHQNKTGKVIVEKFLAVSLQGNHSGEDPLRKVTIYLPPGYAESKQRYPVIYFLHGGIEKKQDSVFLTWWDITSVLDTAIQKGHIRPVIFVVPNGDINLGTSFYTNSSLTGNWSDYIAKDLVTHIDKHYRTITNKESRGLCGHSSGGMGALKIGMLYPEVFGAVYALSPAVLGWGGDFTMNDPVFKTIDSFKNQYTMREVFADLIQRNDFTKFHTISLASMAKAYSPDENVKTFLSAKMPVKYIGDSMIVDVEILKKWESNFPINMIETHLAALKSLSAIKLDWGRNEQNSHVPITCLEFSKKLEANKVKHFAEEYIGNHISNIGGIEGRIYTSMFPFFDTYLKFEDKTK